LTAVSCLYEIPKNNLVDDMSCSLWPSVTFRVLLPHRNAERLHLQKAENEQLCDSRVRRATAGAEAQFWNLRQPWRNPFLSPILPPTSAPLLFNEGLGVSPWEICGIKDVCRLVLEHFDGLMRLVMIPWNKKVHSPAKFPYLFCRPIFPCRILCRRMPLDAPGGCGSEGLPGVPRILQWRGPRRGAWPGGLGDLSPPMGSRAKPR